MDETPPLNRDYIKAQKVCVTGRLVSMTHAELAELVESCGGTFVRTPTRSSMILVVGDNGWPAEGDGSPNRVLVRARRLRALGYPIELVSEDEFLDKLGLSKPADAMRGHYTTTELARILGISPARIRRWVRDGLIFPVAVQHRLAYFDFRQVSFSKHLCELLESGVQLNAVRRGIEQFEGWLPHTRDHLLQLAQWERGGNIVVRANDRLYDGSGQRYFDFEAFDGAERLLSLPCRTEHSEGSALFDEALQLEDEGQLDEAADRYRRAIELDPSNPILHFNLGNVLYNLREIEASASSFGEALARDPHYAEAWNNLGNVYTELARWEDAEDALRQAVQLVPNYANARFNLAEILERLGQSDEAAVHRRAYEQHCSSNPLQAGHTSVLKVFGGSVESENECP